MEHAPDFTLQDQDKNKVSLSEIKSTVVLYFYPKDDTPGCTIEAQMFTQDLPLYKKLGAEVIGISGLDEDSKKKFCDKYDLGITLLADPDFKVAKAYDVYKKKKFMGREYLGITRTTFIIKNGKIIKRFDNVKPKTHSKEVLKFLEEENEEN